MNHRPFEDWLLNDEFLTPEQQRELQAHMRVCDACATLAEVNLALRSARIASPAPGFVTRFETRLAAQRALQQRRMVLGMTILAVGGLGLLTLFAWPLLTQLIESPASILVTLVGYFSAIWVWAQALAGIGSVFGRVMPELVPPYIWMMVASALGGLLLLWGVSLWRFTRIPQRVIKERV